MRIPTLIVDNFYEDPDRVRDFALSLDYPDSSDRYPGKRTSSLKLINKNFFDYCTKKVNSLLFSSKDRHECEVNTSFQYIEPFSSEVENYGWIHNDKPCLFTCILYLTPNVNLNSGTSIYHENENFDIEKFEKFSDSRKTLYGSSFVDEKYEENWRLHREMFTETVRVDNVYNRLLIFDAQQWHGVPTYNTSTMGRLTQTFFLTKLISETPPPITRSNSVKFDFLELKTNL